MLRNVYEYIAVDNQEYNFDAYDKVTNFEYYIIDSIDDSGNVKFKKYDFTNYT